ncbi:hypothetical protein Bca101_082921 [Brassica carinata]
MKKRITLKKKSDPGKFAIPCLVKGIEFPCASATQERQSAFYQTEEYDEDYEEERAIEYHGLPTEEDRVFHHSYGIRNATSIDRDIST